MFSDKKGMAMLLVVSLILFLFILGGAVVMVSSGHFGTSYHQIKGVRAYYAAEAGMQHALWKCGGGDGGYNLENIYVDGAGAAPKFRSDSITVSDPNYSFSVNIKVYEIGSDPLGTGAITDTYPIVISVVY